MLFAGILESLLEISKPTLSKKIFIFFQSLYRSSSFRDGYVEAQLNPPLPKKVGNVLLGFIKI